LSDDLNPQFFGMAANADKALQMSNVNHVVGALRSLAAVDKSSSGIVTGTGLAVSAAHDPRVWAQHMTPLWRFWDTTVRTSLSRFRGFTLPIQPDANTSPLETFVCIDAQQSHKIIEYVSKELSTFQKVCAGTLLSTSDIQNAAAELMIGEVPANWPGDCWPTSPSDPMTFLTQLIAKYVALRTDWFTRLQSRALVDQEVRLSDFLRPDVFLNAMRQQTGRELNVPIDSLHLVSAWDRSLFQDSSVPISCTLSGLLLEGCAFDDNRKILLESNRSTANLTQLPPVSIAWLPKQSHPNPILSHNAQAPTIGVPVYVTHNRLHFVCKLYAHTDHVRSRVLSSCAIFISETI